MYGTTSGREQNVNRDWLVIRRRFVPPWFETLMKNTKMDIRIVNLNYDYLYFSSS